MGGIVIVTGACRGIGLAIADVLAAADWRTIRADVAFDNKAIDRYPLDVTKYADVEALVNYIEGDVGPIQGLVNNAGITRDAYSHRMDPKDWADVIAVNLTGSFNLCRAILPAMRQRRFGRIVNISSMNGLKGQAGQVNYAAAKGGLIAMTKTIALETASLGITANCIAPGFIDTEMTQAIRADVRENELIKIPVGRLGRSEEIAMLVKFLLSEDAAFITGETVSINGGQYMR